MNFKASDTKVKRKGGVQYFGCHEFGHIKRYCSHRKKNVEKEYDDIAGYISSVDILTIFKDNNISFRDG